MHFQSNSFAIDLLQDFGVYTEYCVNYSRGNEFLESSLSSSTELRAIIKVCVTLL